MTPTVLLQLLVILHCRKSLLLTGESSFPSSFNTWKIRDAAVCTQSFKCYVLEDKPYGLFMKQK